MLQALERDNSEASWFLLTYLADNWHKMFHRHSGEQILTFLEEHSCEANWVECWLRTNIHIDLAWLARGNGWANTVKEDQWRAFHRHLERGEQCPV
jgi:hypothetical protein